MNKKELEGKVAIVTGGGSGIGKMSALSYAESGAKVVVADISERDGQNVTDEIVEKGGEAIFVKTDVSQAQDNENLVNKALEVYGKLDIAFNNAGIKGLLLLLLITLLSNGIKYYRSIYQVFFTECTIKYRQCLRAAVAI